MNTNIKELVLIEQNLEDNINDSYMHMHDHNQRGGYSIPMPLDY